MTKNYVKENLHRLRENRGLTCQELADILGVSKQTISNWERLKVPMNDVTAYGIIYVCTNIIPNDIERIKGDNEEWKELVKKIKEKY